MQLRFRLFVQQHSGGAWTILVPAAPALAAYAATRDEAIRDIAAQLSAHLASAGPRAVGRYPFHERQDLRPIALEVSPKGGGPQPPIAISVNVLVTDARRGGAGHLLITAPRIADFHVVAPAAEQIEELARAALLHHMRKWRSPAIVAADLDGEETLATLTIELPDAPAPAEPSGPPGGEQVLALCGLNLSEQAGRGKLGRADRRDTLVEHVLTALAGERMSSVVLVGRADVGKTAILHEVVERIRAGSVPPALRDREVWFVTANNLIAGMKYTGEWQGRAQKLVQQARRGRQILYMADPNEILDAGRWSGSDNNMGRFLRPYIESGELTIICECAPEGFDAGVKVEPSFMHAFRRVDVGETDEADTLAIAHAAARRLEAAHGVAIEPDATAAALSLTRRFMPYRAFPGKAVRFLADLARDAAQQPGARLGRDAAIRAFARATGLPAFIVSDEQGMRADEVRAYFDERLLGQPDAVAAMVDLITVIKAGLHDPAKPLGSFFFVGPTGVGKTELAKVLAEFLFGARDRLIRFDMSEYAGPDALPRLIGTAWKPDSAGELARRVREQPFCVLLFDELEKAHSDVFDALLQVLGEGRLTDAAGRTADFRNAIIIMTSNLGASRREMHDIGFAANGRDGQASDDARLRAHFTKEAEQFFRPEFFNRIDRIVAFRPLTLAAMRLITRRELGKLLMREGVVRRNLLVEIDDAVIERLLAQGFHPLYGARPLQREIERLVILPLARLVVEHNPGAGQLLRFGVREGQIQLSLVSLEVADEPAETPAARAADARIETDLAAVLRAVRELRAQAADEAAGPVVRGLRREVSALLRRTGEPSFWDAPQAAREVLGRVYHLERVLKRFDELAERAEYLEEKGRQIRIRRDRRGIPELARDLDTLEAELAYVRMELAGAGAGSGHDQALLKIAPLGRASDAWADQLLAMYSAWAAHKGHEYTILAPEGAGARPRGTATLYVRGSNVYEFLRGEAGLHKLLSGPAEDRQRDLARVTVLPAQGVPDDDPAELYGALAQLALAGDTADDDGALARIYTSSGRHRSVRDPRTGARVADVGAVLQGGQIDAFLLASLRARAAEAA
ncbi:AAA family ATPase [Kouleothrix sp.]|uniref:AAA family ATPase n=1 Tax=Kouleothrix sp. TaxID=2779161 RepID=UPI00391B16F9